jgi:hypothetical protein
VNGEGGNPRMEARLEAIKDKEDFDREFLASERMM